MKLQIQVIVLLNFANLFAAVVNTLRTANRLRRADIEERKGTELRKTGEKSYKDQFIFNFLNNVI